MTTSPKTWLILIGVSVTLAAWGLHEILTGLFDPILRRLGA